MGGMGWRVRRVGVVDEGVIGGLCEVLVDCVEGGASVGFMRPLTRERAEAFWRGVARGVEAGERALLVAEDAAGVCGTVHLVLAQMENQPHRADLVKMLVHRRARRQGVGRALMAGAETMARECGKTLLVLDAVTGGEAARMYEGMGWVRVGDIPRYALMPGGEECGTTYFYREVGGRYGRLERLVRADEGACGGPFSGAAVAPPGLGRTIRGLPGADAPGHILAAAPRLGWGDGGMAGGRRQGGCYFRRSSLPLRFTMFL